MEQSVLIVSVEPPRLATYRNLLSPFFDVVGLAGSFADATEALGAAPPRVLVCESRLREYHGLHLALWTRVRHPEVRSILVGEPDAVLERDTAVINVSYVSSGDLADVVHAALEAAEREQPRRRWMRRPLTADLAIDVAGRPARVLDMSYGGLRFEMPSPPARDDEDEDDDALPIAIPQFDLITRATRRWTTAAATPGSLLCGVALGEEDARPGSRWRVVVDAVAGRAAAPTARV